MSTVCYSRPSGSTRTNTRSTMGSASIATTLFVPSYDELFGAAPPQPPKATPSPSQNNIFDSFKDPVASTVPPSPKPKHSSMPMFDKLAYDDDILSLDGDDKRVGLVANGAVDALSAAVS